jgi:hypothetical protein
MVRSPQDDQDMKVHYRPEEIRWQVVKAMLDEFPVLKEKVRNYVEGQNQKDN